MQNFNDKRSRYTPGSGNVQVTIPLKWLESDVIIRKGRAKERWEASRWFSVKPTAGLTLTIRHLRSLFVLPDADFKAFGANHLPAGHEYFCRHRDLAQISQQGMQSFVKGMALMNHFRHRP